MRKTLWLEQSEQGREKEEGRQGGREETGASGPREAGTEEGYGQRKGPGPESGAHWRPLVVHC